MQGFIDRLNNELNQNALNNSAGSGAAAGKKNKISESELITMIKQNKTQGRKFNGAPARPAEA